MQPHGIRSPGRCLVGPGKKSRGRGALITQSNHTVSLPPARGKGRCAHGPGAIGPVYRVR
jgi:hypothetical protein